MLSKTINANQTAITESLVLASLATTDLHWEMHAAQVYSLQIQSFTAYETLEAEAKDLELFKHETKLTLLGLPVVVDSEKYPKGLIRLMLGKVELARIECLAIPSAFVSDEDYTEEGRKKESDKFYNLR
jgi:hypothetical protein